MLLIVPHRFIINDSFRTELCLLYPPHYIAVAALYMTCVLHNSLSSKLHPPSNGGPYVAASAVQSPATTDAASGTLTPTTSGSSPRDDILNFLADLNISIELIGTICQQILTMYDLWDCFTDGSEQDQARRADRQNSHRQYTYQHQPIPPPVQNLITEREIAELVVRMRTERELQLGHPSSGRPVGENPRLVRVVHEPPSIASS